MSKGPALFNDEISSVESLYPKLKAVAWGDKLIVSGEIDIVDNEGKYWDSYSIEVHCPDEYPDRFPAVYETSGKIPKIADWHIYEDTGACCLKIEQEEIIRCSKGVTLVDFFKEELLPYFFNQTHRRIEGYYVNGEHSHGLLGIFEYYDTELSTSGNVRLMIKLMYYIATEPRPGRTSNCFCGSRKKFRNCHRSAFDKLLQIGSKQLKHDAFRIGKAAKLL